MGRKRSTLAIWEAATTGEAPIPLARARWVAEEVRMMRACLGNPELQIRVSARVLACAFGLVFLTPLTAASQEPAARSPAPENLRRENLAAWCIVPFDAAKRGPVERAEMLGRLGLRRCAYDWRDEHVASFEAQIDAYREHGIEFFAFWDQHPEAFRLFAEHGLRPQVWMTCPGPEAEGQDAKVRAAADALEPAAAKAAAIGSAFGLYNHGGWGGEPENLVAVCQELRRRGHDRTGVVYNLHHAHHRAATFAADLQLLKPYLLCLNLNGTNPDGQPKILTFGQGSSDREILAALLDSGYQGPVGVIDHQPDTDSEPTLKANLEGLERLLGELRGSP